MFLTSFAGNATSKFVYVRAQVISTGLPYTAGAYNTATISAQYVRAGAAAVSITLATQTASGAWASGGFVHVGKGRYRLDIPNAAIASGVDYTTYDIDGIADVVWVGAKTEITGSDPRAAVSSDVNVISMAANTVTASAVATDAVTEIQSGLATSSALTTVAGYIDTEVAAIKAVTDSLTIASGRVAANITAIDGNTTATIAEATTLPAINNSGLFARLQFMFHKARNPKKVDNAVPNEILYRADATTALETRAITTTATTFTEAAGT